jgi:uncharacterized protein YbjT (DUF2867 family)
MEQPSKPSRVLLLGATGNLGSRLLPTLLAHRHAVIAFVRSPTKLASLIAPSLLSHSDLTVVEGDATDSSAIRRAIVLHDCDAIADVAGNQVAPWKEPVLERIVGAVVDAAVKVGRERGRPLRAWVIGGMGSLRYPGTDRHLIQA